MEQWDLRTVLKGKNPWWVQEPLEMSSANLSRPPAPTSPSRALPGAGAAAQSPNCVLFAGF